MLILILIKNENTKMLLKKVVKLYCYLKIKNYQHYSFKDITVIINYNASLVPITCEN